LTFLLTIWKAKAKIWSMLIFEFFLKFWTFYWSVQSSFSFLFQKYNSSLNGTKIDIFSNCFLVELFFFGGGIPFSLENNYQECKKIVRSFLSSFRLVPHNVNGMPPTLWPTMWLECEENVGLNEDAY